MNLTIHCEGRKIRLEKLLASKSYTDDDQAIKEAIADGEITPDEGLQTIQTIAIGAKLKEATELEERLVEIEKSVGRQK